MNSKIRNRNSKKLLILSLYFEPDLCAGSFRNSALVREVLKVFPDDTQIDVVTTMPSRYASYNVTAYHERG